MLSHAPFFVLALYCLLNFLFRFLYSALLYLALISWCTSFFVVCLYLQFHFFLVSLIWCLCAIQLLFFWFFLVFVIVIVSCHVLYQAFASLAVVVPFTF